MREIRRQRVFLTFGAGDLAQARPVTARLVTGGGMILDQAYTSEPFVGAPGEFIRASLLTRLRHCAAALCLYGPRTTDDDWVRWALEAAAELELPVLGAALPGADGRESEHFLTRLGAEIVTLDGDVIAARTRSLAPRFAGALDAASLIETLQLMRHSIR
jgi:hypothetical protein